MATTRSTKSRILRLLKEDEEFRYAVAGLIGISDMLNRFEQHDKKFNEIMEEIRELRRDVSKLTTYIERTSITIEEEAREILAHRLRDRGVELRLSSLVLPDMEINVYGANENLCLVGEVSTRAGVRIVEKLNEDIAKLSGKYPQYLRKKTIKVVYTMQATPDAVKEAEASGVWLLKATEDLTQPTF